MNKQHKKPRCDDMYRAILTLKTVDECKQFFDDLCTVTELQAMEQRYQVAQYLDSGLIYNEILEKTGASSATISRVNRSLQYGNGGYEIVFARLRELTEKAREANTILSKSSDLEISNIAIDLKTEIEKVREQIQNVE